MCVEGCEEVVRSRLMHQAMFSPEVILTPEELAAHALAARNAQTVSFGKVFDLTHRTSESTPTYNGVQQFRRDIVATYDPDKYNAAWWRVHEHTGTHIDAPLHMSADGPSVADIPAEALVLPLAVIDVSSKASLDPDYALSVADVLEWEATHGSLPDACCVAMNSGWAAHYGTRKFRNVDMSGLMHFPGFAAETAHFLLSERNVLGVASDTLSLDPGNSTTFDFHYAWLPTGRWGVECVAALSDVPATGAMIVVGAPKVDAASGGPSRVLALV